MSPIINSSADPATDALNAPGVCGHGTPLGGYQDRCGYGQRLPMMVISPYAKTNYVDSTMTDQTSIINFVEDNWLGGERISSSSFDNLSGLSRPRRQRFRDPGCPGQLGAGSSASAAAADHSHEAAVAGAPIPGHSSVARPWRSWPPPDAGGRAATCASWEGAVQARLFLARATYRVTLSTATVAAGALHPPVRYEAAFAPVRAAP
jgi:hypothetical protein